MYNKKVSIIIPCYNQGKFVADAINCALEQTYKNIEIVVVNDGSNDNSADIIKSFADKYKNILFFDEKENKGVVYARNMAIEACQGEYILPLDADDKIDKTYVEKAVEILDKNPKIGMVYCKARYFGDKNEFWKLPDFNKSLFLYVNCIFNCALFRKSDFLKAGKYKYNMEYGSEDWDLWLSFVEMGLEPYRLNEILFQYRIHSKESRNHKSSKYTEQLFLELIKNHTNLYLNDEKIVKHFSIVDFSKIQKRAVKYKKLFNIVLIISIAEFFILIIGFYFLFIYSKSLGA